MSGHGSAHMSTDDLCFARVTGGDNKNKNNTTKHEGRKGGKKQKEHSERTPHQGIEYAMLSTTVV